MCEAVQWEDMARRKGRGREANAMCAGLRRVIVMGAEFMSGRPDRIVALLEVDMPESRSCFFIRALEDGVAVVVTDGYPKSREDGGAFRVTERANAEQVVIERRHPRWARSSGSVGRLREAVTAECWHWQVAVPMAMGGPVRSMLTMGAVGIK